jgi:hypothetical protein
MNARRPILRAAPPPFGYIFDGILRYLDIAILISYNNSMSIGK